MLSKSKTTKAPLSAFVVNYTLKGIINADDHLLRARDRVQLLLRWQHAR